MYNFTTSLVIMSILTHTCPQKSMVSVNASECKLVSLKWARVNTSFVGLNGGWAWMSARLGSPNEREREWKAGLVLQVSVSFVRGEWVRGCDMERNISVSDCKLERINAVRTRVGVRIWALSEREGVNEFWTKWPPLSDKTSNFFSMKSKKISNFFKTKFY